MKSIIIPVDFSDQSEQALKVAAQIASKNKAELFVLHMLELSPTVMANTEYIPQEHVIHLMKITEKRFSDFLDKSYLKDIKVTPIIKHYKVLSEVSEVAEKHNADLIVMGSHGTDGLEEIFIGSNTERVVRTSEIPVLVIKGDIERFTPNTFVFASDFTDEAIDSLMKAQGFATKLGAKLKPVYINTPGDAFLSHSDAYNMIAKALHKARLGLEVDIYNDYTVEKGVLNYAESQNADLIGIPTHGRKGLAHFFMGSIGEDVANHSQVPVLTFKI